MRGLNLVYRHSIQKPLKLCIMLKHNKKKQSPLLHNISTLENECVFIIHQLYLKWLEKVKSWISARPKFGKCEVGTNLGDFVQPLLDLIWDSTIFTCRKVNKLLINFAFSLSVYFYQFWVVRSLLSKTGMCQNNPQFQRPNKVRKKLHRFQ